MTFFLMVVMNFLFLGAMAILWKNVVEAFKNGHDYSMKFLLTLFTSGTTLALLVGTWAFNNLFLTGKFSVI